MNLNSCLDKDYNIIKKKIDLYIICREKVKCEVSAHTFNFDKLNSDVIRDDIISDK